SFRRTGPADLRRLRDEQIDSDRRCGQLHRGVLAPQFLLAAQIGLDIATVDADVVQHAVVERRKLTSRATAGAGVRQAHAQAREQARRLALRQTDSAACHRVDLTPADAKISQFVLIQLGELTDRLLVEAPCGSPLRTLIETQRAHHRAPEATNLLCDEL